MVTEVVLQLDPDQSQSSSQLGYSF
ncbi:hypothetical protein Pint_10936 [Pistacia integerrima]|uniref:Uncharacterized protein n=1 Tax=Pistacia integerrima TaxID=434235 RepID=A0ACC0XKI4_9ROSI|nr:hypothetical protein Pint_10936 [Pistacia integerrima]